MVMRVKPVLRVLAVVLVTTCLVQCANSKAAEDIPLDVASVSKMAWSTKEPAKLKWAVEGLLLRGDEAALAEAQKLLEDGGRLDVLDPKIRRFHPEEMHLFAVLRFAAENLEGDKASGLLVALSRCPEYRPHEYEEQLMKEVEAGRGYVMGSPESDAANLRMDKLMERQNALVGAMGCVRGASKEVVAYLKEELEAVPGLLLNERVARTLGRIGTKEAFAVLLGGPPSSAWRLADRRDRPEVFKFLVDGYLRWNEDVSERLLHEVILSQSLHVEGGVERLHLPDFYLDVAGEDAAALVKEFDRLLAQEHRALTDDERREVKGIRDLLHTRDEEYKKHLKKEGEDEGAEGQGEAKEKSEADD